MLPLLFCLQVEPGEAAQVLFANSLVHSGPTADPFSVIVGSVGPPVSLGLYISKDHILYGRWQPRDLKCKKHNEKVTGATRPLRTSGSGNPNPRKMISMPPHLERHSPSRECWPSSSARLH